MALFAVIGAGLSVHRQNDVLSRAARQSIAASAVLLAIAVSGLLVALVRLDLSLRYVAEHTTLNLPLSYRIATLWSGAAGQRLFFALLLTALAALAARRFPAGGAPGRWSTAVLALASFGAVLWATLGSPFATLAWNPREGTGLLPRLQSPVAAAATPVALLSLAVLVVAGALAVDARQHGRLPRWLLAAWLGGTVALALGFTAADGTLSRTGIAATLAAVAPTLAMWTLLAALLFLAPMRTRWWPRGRALSRALAAAFLGGGLLIALSFTGRSRTAANAVTLAQGGTVRLDGPLGEWIFAQQGISAFHSGNREVTAVTVEATPVAGGRYNLLVSEQRQSVDSRGEAVFAPMVTTAVARRAGGDVALTLVRALPDENAELRIEFRPFASWLYLGLGLLVLSAAVAWVRAPAPDA